MSPRQSFYDRLAPFYEKYSKKRKKYLDAIDKIIIKQLSGKSLLDVGAGDRLRAKALASKTDVNFLVLTEPSGPMFKLCQKVKASHCFLLKAEKLNKLPYRFDTIICLWNVLGHIKTSKDKIRALKNMRNLLSDKGTLFLDVNNRYNLRAYGVKKVVANVVKDLLSPSETNGDVSFTIHIGGQAITATSHVFSPQEINQLIRKSKLRIQKRYFIDYDTGQRRRTFLEGQILLELKKYPHG